MVWDSGSGMLLPNPLEAALYLLLLYLAESGYYVRLF